MTRIGNESVVFSSNPPEDEPIPQNPAQETQLAHLETLKLEAKANLDNAKQTFDNTKQKYTAQMKSLYEVNSLPQETKDKLMVDFEKQLGTYVSSLNEMVTAREALEEAKANNTSPDTVSVLKNKFETAEAEERKQLGALLQFENRQVENLPEPNKMKLWNDLVNWQQVFLYRGIAESEYEKALAKYNEALTNYQAASGV